MSDVWIGLSNEELVSIREALAEFRSNALHRKNDTDRLIGRSEAAASHLKITVGVYGGLVQWVQGNPFPIRIVDYDGDVADLPDRDDEGLRALRPAFVRLLSFLEAKLHPSSIDLGRSQVNMIGARRSRDG